VGVVAAAMKPKLVVDTTRADSLALDSSDMAPMYSYLDVVLGVASSSRLKLRFGKTNVGAVCFLL